MNNQIIKIFDRQGEVIGTADSADAWSQEYHTFKDHLTTIKFVGIKIEVAVLSEDDSDFLLGDLHKEFMGMDIRAEIKQLLHPDEGPPELINYFGYKIEDRWFTLDLHQIGDYSLRNGIVMLENLMFSYTFPADFPKPVDNWTNHYTGTASSNTINIDWAASHASGSNIVHFNYDNGSGTWSTE